MKREQIPQLRSLIYGMEIGAASKQLTDLKGELEPAFAEATPARAPQGCAAWSPKFGLLLGGVLFVTLSFAGILLLGSARFRFPGPTPSDAVVPTPSPTLPAAAGIPETDRALDAAAGQVLLAVLLVILAIAVWRLKWLVGLLGRDRYTALRLTRGVIEVATSSFYWAWGCASSTSTKAPSWSGRSSIPPPVPDLRLRRGFRHQDDRRVGEVKCRSLSRALRLRCPRREDARQGGDGPVPVVGGPQASGGMLWAGRVGGASLVQFGVAREVGGADRVHV